MKSKEATYVGGSLDGKLVRPSLVRACVSKDLPIIHSYHIPTDYPMAMTEYYTPEENEEGVIFKLTKSEREEIIGE